MQPTKCFRSDGGFGKHSTRRAGKFQRRRRWRVHSNDSRAAFLRSEFARCSCSRRNVSDRTEGLGSIQQGALENSNVDVVGEFIQMILAQRSYEANSRVVHAADEMFQTINGLTT